MGYDGEIVTSLPVGLHFSGVFSVVVSGDFPNPCGHALLYVPGQSGLGGSGGRYFQVAGGNKQPHVLTDDSFKRYLTEHGKKEIRRFYVELPDPAGAEKRLTELIGKRWLWAVLPHNCAAFVEDVVSAGGSTAGLVSNCPRWEDFEPPFYERAARRMESEIRRLYGVPF